MLSGVSRRRENGRMAHHRLEDPVGLAFLFESLENRRRQRESDQRGKYSWTTHFGVREEELGFVVRRRPLPVRIEWRATSESL